MTPINHVRVNHIVTTCGVVFLSLVAMASFTTWNWRRHPSLPFGGLDMQMWCTGLIVYILLLALFLLVKKHKVANRWVVAASVGVAAGLALGMIAMLVMSTHYRGRW